MKLFVNGCEDVDLCLRMSEEGLDNYVVHDSCGIPCEGCQRGTKNYLMIRMHKSFWNDGRGSILSNQSVTDQYSGMQGPTYYRGYSKTLVNQSEQMDRGDV